MMSNPVVSVITPLFNKDKYLASCIDSVLSQSYENWEMLIVDDGSTDASRSILNEYVAKYPRKIIALEHPKGVNLGVSASRQLATSQANGELIAYLDADDLWMPEKLAHDVEIFSSSPDSAAVISRSIYFFDHGEEPARVDKLAPTYQKTLPPGTLFKSFFFNTEIEAPCPCSVTIRRAIVEKLSPWDVYYSVAEDLKYFGELYYRFPVYVSKHCLAYYRRLGNSAWSCAMRDGSEAEALKRLEGWIQTISHGINRHRQ